MQRTEELLNKLRKNWSDLSKSKCIGTVAIVDLTASTRFKSLFPSPDIWVERLNTFLEIVHSTRKEIFKKKLFFKNLGDGVLIFSKNDQVCSHSCAINKLLSFGTPYFLETSNGTAVSLVPWIVNTGILNLLRSW